MPNKAEAEPDRPAPGLVDAEPSGGQPASTQMAREIAEQPEALERTLTALLPRRAEIAALAAGRRRILFLARGSSDNAAVYARYLAEIHAGIPASLAAASVATLYHAQLDLSDTLVVCVSQSGSTEEIVEAQQWARQAGAATIAVTNFADSPLAGGADIALVTRAGLERAVPATKSYTTQVAALAVAVDALAPHAGTLDREFAAVPAEAERMLVPTEDLEAIVAGLAGTQEVLASGRGLAFGTTLEVALKLEETCLRPVRGLSYADLKHGPIAIVDHDLVTLLVAGPEGPTLPGLVELAGTLKATGSPVFGIGGNADFRGACDLSVPGPQLSEKLAPLALIIPPQLITERLALRLGLDPDAPRGLNKVTQTD